MFCFQVVDEDDDRRWRIISSSNKLVMESSCGQEPYCHVFYRIRLCGNLIVSEGISRKQINTTWKYVQQLIAQKCKNTKHTAQILKEYQLYFMSLPRDACSSPQNLDKNAYQQIFASLKEKKRQSNIIGDMISLHDVFTFLHSSDPRETLRLYFKEFTTEAIVHLQDRRQQTLLHISTVGNKLSFVKLLLDSGADIQAKEKYGWTSLHIACYYGLEDIIKELIKRNALVMSLTNALETPLHYLVQCDLEWRILKPLISLLLDQGADINACDRNNGTPLYYACTRSKNTNCIQYLLDNGSFPDIKYQNQQTCLHASVKERDIKICSILLKGGANPAIQTTSKGDALDIANQTKNESLITLIRDALPERSKLSSSNPSLFDRPKLRKRQRTSQNMSPNVYVSSPLRQMDVKRKNLGVPESTQLYIESFPCVYNGLNGQLHMWQDHLAFEPISSKKKPILIAIENIVGHKKIPVPSSAIEIRLKRETYTFTSFQYLCEPAHNVLEYLVSMKGKDIILDMNGFLFCQKIGEIKFPDASKEMKERFKGVMDEADALVDYCNATMFSIGNIQIPLGKGRLYLTFKGILFYSRVLSTENRLYIPYSNIHHIQEEDETGLILDYTDESDKTKILSRTFSLPSTTSRDRIYEWIEEEWKRAMATIAVPIICLISPRSQLLDNLIKNFLQHSTVRVLLLDLPDLLDSLLVPIPNQNDADYQKSTIVEVIKVNINAINNLDCYLNGVTHIFYMPPLSNMIEITKNFQNSVEKVISDVKSIIYILPNIPLIVNTTTSPEQEYISNIKLTKSKFDEWKLKLEKENLNNNNNNLNITLLELNPILEMFDYLIDCVNFKIFTTSQPISWISYYNIAKAITLLLLSESPNLNNQHILTGSIYIDSDTIQKSLFEILQKSFNIESNILQFVKSYRECYASHNIKLNDKELNFLENYLEILSEYKTTINPFLKEGLDIDSISFIDYLRYKCEWFLTSMGSSILSNAESNYMASQFQYMLLQNDSRNEILLDEPSFSSCCGKFFVQSGLAGALFNAFICNYKKNNIKLSPTIITTTTATIESNGEENSENSQTTDLLKISSNSYVSGSEILLRGTLQEKSEFVYNMFEYKSIDYTGFHKEHSIDRIISIIDILLHGTQTNEIDSSIQELLDSIRKKLENTFDNCKKIKENNHLNLNEFLEWYNLSFDILRTFGGRLDKYNMNHSMPLGIPIVVGHRNWELSWYIMRGISLSVKFAEENLTSKREKESFEEIQFDITSEWTIIDQSPCIFKRIRDLFGVSSSEYLDALGIEYFIGKLLCGSWNCYHELNSSGRSGSLFYSSWNGKYFLKTLPEEEELFLIKNLEEYYYYVTTHRNTLLTQFYGLFKIRKGNQGPWIHIVIMNNFLKSTKYHVQEIYDLKGSTVNRHVELTVSQQERPTIARKDNDFSRLLRIGKQAKSLILEVIERDIRWMESLNITDYSLLVGIHTFENPDERKEDTTIQELLQIDNPDSLPFSKVEGGILSSSKKHQYYIGLIDILGQ